MLVAAVAAAPDAVVAEAAEAAVDVAPVSAAADNLAGRLVDIGLPDY